MKIELLHTLITNFKSEFIYKSDINNNYTININDFPLYKIKNNSIIIKVYDNENNEYALKIFLESTAKAAKHYNTIIKNYETFKTNLLIPISFYTHELSIPKLGSAFTNLHILIMPWIHGQTLKTKLENLCFVNNIDGIKFLLENFKKLINQKITDNIIHGDLSLENVIVEQTGKCNLIDFDTLYTEELENIVHFNQLSNFYTLPKRKPLVYNLYSDDFASLIIYTTIYTLTLRPELLLKYKKEQSFLFTKETIYQWETSQLKNDLNEIKDNHLNDLILSISTALKRNSIEIENLNELIFLKSTDNEEFRKHKLQIAYLKACLEDNEYLLTGLNNEIAKQTILSDKIKYEKKILEEEVKLYKIQNIKRKSNASLKKMMAVAASILILGFSLLFTYNYLKKSNKENLTEDAIVNSKVLNNSPSVTTNTVSNTSSKIKNENSNSTQDINIPVSKSILENEIKVKKENTESQLNDKNSTALIRKPIILEPKSFVEKTTTLNNHSEKLNSEKVNISKTNFEENNSTLNTKNINKEITNIKPKPQIEKSVLAKSVTFKPLD